MATKSNEKESLLCKPHEASEMLQISVPKVYELCAKGVLKTIRIGRAIRIQRSSILELAAGSNGHKAESESDSD